MASDGVDVYAAGSAVAGGMCWICQTPIMAGDEIVFCPHDKLPSHAECWENNEGCPVYGCRAAPGYGQVGVQALATQKGEANYHCLVCHKSVKPSFLKCSFCGSPIPLDNVVNNVEFDDFKFRAKENDRIRPAVWCLFMMAATGILAPLVLVILIYMKMKGSIGRLRFSYMLRDTRALYFATTLISIGHLVALVTILLLDA